MDSSPYLREISVCSFFYAIEFYHLLAKYKALQEKYLTQSGYFNHIWYKSDVSGMYIFNDLAFAPRFLDRDFNASFWGGEISQ